MNKYNKPETVIDTENKELVARGDKGGGQKRNR